MQCVFCQIKLDPMFEYSDLDFQPCDGGEIKLIFAYGSKYDCDVYRGTICDVCAEGLFDKMHKVQDIDSVVRRTRLDEIQSKNLKEAIDKQFEDQKFIYDNYSKEMESLGIQKDELLCVDHDFIIRVLENHRKNMENEDELYTYLG